MQTITSKQLRDNLGAIAKRVQHGEQIRVTYRHKPAFSLVPDRPVAKQPRQGVSNYLIATQDFVPRPANKTARTIYHQHLEQKYGSN